MKRRQFLHSTTAAVAALSAPHWTRAQDAQRPLNILWLTCEDMSPNLGCYGDTQASSPHIDSLAQEGLRYTHAFSVSGVCAPSRSCLITGMYPTTLGTMHMRCRNQPPQTVRCFPEYLKAAGYYCTNNRKEDYNFEPPKTVWDDSSAKAHFRNRPNPDQPFFAVFNFTITHESQIGTPLEEMDEDNKKLLEGLEKHDPAHISVPPFYPDTPVIRKHWAHYYDLISAMDRQVGQVLAELEEDGLAENTVVFFYSDHGTGVPRCKRWMYDTGLHVPLVVRWPGALEGGTVTDRLVSFVDFAPTVLSIAGVNIPEHMQGTPFLGMAEGEPRKTIHAARDRMDSRYDILRAVRDKRFKYIRNYEPWIPYDLKLQYPESFAIMQELRRVEAEGGFEGPPALFFRDRKPLEELFDTQADPYEFNNLAEDPAYADTLERLRGQMDSWIRETQDLGMVPEFALEDWLPSGTTPEPLENQPFYWPIDTASEVPTVFGISANDWIRHLNKEERLLRYRAIKTLGLLGAPLRETLTAAVSDPDPIVGFWATRALGEVEDWPESTRLALQGALEGEAVGPALGAAHAFVRHGEGDSVVDRAVEFMANENPWVRLRAVDLLENIGPANPKAEAALRAALEDEYQYVTRIAKMGLGIPGR
jgi:uncharacterized sulfatase